MSLLKASTVLRRSSRYLSQKLNTVAVAQDVDRYSVGQEIHGYKVTQIQAVPELYFTAIALNHVQTGAQHLHIARDDGNNAFGVAFRTTPMDRTGVPHILEHTSLCGSSKFPVRNLFFKMMNRSLSTFMNAFTASDLTMYPFSTQNPKDFRNLMSIYLDATFFPNLTQLDFSQEGWRLEHEDINDPNSPITFKGVVFNEMKGAFSKEQSVFTEKAQRLLLPSHTHTYGVCSGGDPAHIPDLTWKQLRDFHQSHYHPSNSRFYTYGNFPLDDHLEFINENALKKFQQMKQDTSVRSEPRWTQPREASITCAPNPMAAISDKQTTVAMLYLLNDVTDETETFTMSVLGSLLTSGEKAPFYKALIESQLGSNYAPVHGYGADTRDTTFSIGLQGIHANYIETVKAIIEQTIDEVIQEGIDQERIDSLLHQIELAQKNMSENFGLNLGIALQAPWNHDDDPIKHVQTTMQVEKLKQSLKENPKLLQDKVKHYLKDNRHRLMLTMSPDENFNESLQETETEKLNSILSGLNDAEKRDIYDKGLELASKQNEEEDLSCLPSLQVSDIPKQGDTVNLKHVTAAGVPLMLSAQPTNGVTYFNMVTNTLDLDPELKPFLPIFCNVVTSMGTERRDYREFSQQMELYTGGLTASVHLAENPHNDNWFEEGLLFNSYSLDRNVEKMYELWSEIFHSVKLDNERRLSTLVRQMASEAGNSVVGLDQVAMTYAASRLTPTMWMREAMAGITQVTLLKNLAARDDLNELRVSLKRIADFVLHKRNVRCLLVATPESIDNSTSKTEAFLDNIPASEFVPRTPDAGPIYTNASDFTPLACQTHFELPIRVNFVARAFKSTNFTHQDFASVKILGRLMTNKFLHREIREKGGAYGGGADGGGPGAFKFYSYRDPNSTATLNVFDEAVAWATSGSFSQQDIDEAKLAIFAQLDQPVAPGARGRRQFVVGIDDALRETHRQQLFAVTKDHLVNVATKYMNNAADDTCSVILGPESQQLKKDKSWTIRQV